MAAAEAHSGCIPVSRSHIPSGRSTLGSGVRQSALQARRLWSAPQSLSAGRSRTLCTGRSERRRLRGLERSSPAATPAHRTLTHLTRAAPATSVSSLGGARSPGPRLPECAAPSSGGARSPARPLAGTTIPRTRLASSTRARSPGPQFPECVSLSSRRALSPGAQVSAGLASQTPQPARRPPVLLDYNPQKATRRPSGARPEL